MINGTTNPVHGRWVFSLLGAGKTIGAPRNRIDFTASYLGCGLSLAMVYKSKTL